MDKEIPTAPTEPRKPRKKSPFTIFKKIKKRNLVIGLFAIILIALLYYFRGQFIVATVNGTPISRLTLIQALEKQSGKQALDSLIVKTLLLQEAKKQNINIGPEDINAEIKKIEDSVAAQGQNLDQLLSLQGVNREDLSEQVKLQKTAEAIVKKDIKVSDEEIDSYLETNKESFPQGTISGQLREQAKNQLEQQKINQEIQSLVQDLREKANIHYLLKL